MIRSTGVLFVLLILFGCSGEGQTEQDNGVEDHVVDTLNYKINFKITGEIDPELVTDDRNVSVSVQSQSSDNQPIFTKIASGVINEDYKFELNGGWSNVNACKITVGGYNEVIIIEDLPIHVKVEKKEEDDYNFIISGSPQTDQFVYLKSHVADFNKADMIMRSKIFKDPNNITEEQKTEYVTLKRNFQTMFEENLKRKIDSLSPSYATFLALNFLDPRIHQEFYFDQADKFERDIDNHDYAKRFVDDVNMAKERMKGLSIGDEAPDFMLPNTQGDSIRLSSFRGKYILLDFWASWCGPCRAENPNVVNVYSKYKGSDFDILSVSLDQSKEAWLQAIEKDGLDWNHVSDLGYWQSLVVELYKLTGIPKTFLIDKNGIIIAQDLRGAALELKIKEVLGSR